MRIEKITLKNFKMFKNAQFVFPEKDVDLHIISGPGGSGKTTFLDAIKWCFNLSAEGEVAGDVARPVSVELIVRSGLERFVIKRGSNMPSENGGASLVSRLFPNGVKDVLIYGEELGIFNGRKIGKNLGLKFADMSMGDRVLKEMAEIKFQGLMVADSPFCKLDTLKRESMNNLFLQYVRQGQVMLLVSSDERDELGESSDGNELI